MTQIPYSTEFTRGLKALIRGFLAKDSDINEIRFDILDPDDEDGTPLESYIVTKKSECIREFWQFWCKGSTWRLGVPNKITI